MRSILLEPQCYPLCGKNTQIDKMFVKISRNNFGINLVHELSSTPSVLLNYKLFRFQMGCLNKLRNNAPSTLLTDLIKPKNTERGTQASKVLTKIHKRRNLPVTTYQAILKLQHGTTYRAILKLQHVNHVRFSRNLGKYFINPCIFVPQRVTLWF